MTKKLFWALVAGLCPITMLVAQNVKMPENPYRIAKRQLEVIPLHLTYVYQAQTPTGLKLGIDFPIRFVESRFISVNGAERRLTEQYITADLGLFYHEKKQNLALFHTEWRIRRLYNRGFFGQISPIGGLVTLPFMWKNGSDNSPLNNRQFYFGPTIGLGLGKDFGYLWRGRGIPMSIALHATATTLYPAPNWRGHWRILGEASLAYRFSRLNTFVKKIRKN